nr:SPASM domain-containing protein [candidate division Zixibacteria bacterium]
MAFTDFLNLFHLPVFGWVLVEVSSRCTALCTYCPHTVFKDIWEDRLMDLDTFRRLVPVFKKSGLVYLQGWGEPFLNPHFFDMVNIARECGCRVGTSTNGMLLDDSKILRIIDSGLDLLAFSLAGTGASNDNLRRGTELKKIIEVIGKINARKKETGSVKPDIHIAYLLLKSRLDEVEHLPELIDNLGISQVVISTLDFIPDEKLALETIAPQNRVEYDAIKIRLDRVVMEAARMGTSIFYNLYNPDHTRQFCTENIQHSMFVASDGTVSPCVFLNLPMTRPVLENKRGETIYRRVEFGNIHSRSPVAIWNSREYGRFRRGFMTGKPDQFCRACPKMRIG